MHPTLRATLVATIVLAGSHVLSAQQPLPAPSASGREFWLVFQKNFRDHVIDERTNEPSPAAPLELELFISSNVSASGHVEIPGLGFRKEFTIAPGAVKWIEIDSAAQLRGSSVIEKLGVHVVADQPVTVYALDRRYQSTETYLAIPVEALGNEYRAMAYRWLQNDLISQMAVVATEDATVVRIVPSVPVTHSDRTPADLATSVEKSAALVKPIEVTLNEGEAFQLIAAYDPKGTSDLTGTLVTSTKPVAVFSGHNCAYVPDVSVKSCNMLAEQMPPTRTWGRTFGVGAIEERSYSVLRVLAREDSTVVTIGGREVAVLDGGEYYENARLTEDALVLTSKPALVAQFSPGFGNGDGAGDPMMIIVPPLEQYDNVYMIATPVRGSWRHYVNIVAKSEHVEALSIDGHAVDQTRFKVLGKTGYSVGRLEISYGTHVVSGRESFGLYQYGIGFEDMAYDAYGNAGGQLYIDLDALEDQTQPDDELPDIGYLTR